MSKANLKNLYSKFQTDHLKEVQGMDLDLGVCVITCARAGGSNLEYETDFQKTFQPYNQIMALDEMPEDKARELTYGIYARTIIKRWRFRDPETMQLVDGLGVDDDGKVVPMTEKGVIELFMSAHDMYLQVRRFSQSMESYLIAGRAPAAKN